MVLGPRYDVIMGVFLLVASAAFAVLSGLDTLIASATLLPFVLFVGAGVVSLVASRRPEATVAGRRLDYLTWRGLASVMLGSSIILNELPGLSLDGSGGSSLLFVVVALFPVGLGVATMLRKEWALVESRTDRTS